MYEHEKKTSESTNSLDEALEEGREIYELVNNQSDHMDCPTNKIRVNTKKDAALAILLLSSSLGKSPEKPQRKPQGDEASNDMFKAKIHLLFNDKPEKENTPHSYIGNSTRKHKPIGRKTKEYNPLQMQQQPSTASGNTISQTDPIMTAQNIFTAIKSKISIFDQNINYVINYLTSRFGVGAESLSDEDNQSYFKKPGEELDFYLFYHDYQPERYHDNQTIYNYNIKFISMINDLIDKLEEDSDLRKEFYTDMFLHMEQSSWINDYPDIRRAFFDLLALFPTNPDAQRFYIELTVRYLAKKPPHSYMLEDVMFVGRAVGALKNNPALCKHFADRDYPKKIIQFIKNIKAQPDDKNLEMLHELSRMLVYLNPEGNFHVWVEDFENEYVNIAINSVRYDAEGKDRFAGNETLYNETLTNSKKMLKDIKHAQSDSTTLFLPAHKIEELMKYNELNTKQKKKYQLVMDNLSKYKNIKNDSPRRDKIEALTKVGTSITQVLTKSGSDITTLHNSRSNFLIAYWVDINVQIKFFNEIESEINDEENSDDNLFFNFHQGESNWKIFVSLLIDILKQLGLADKIGNSDEEIRNLVEEKHTAMYQDGEKSVLGITSSASLRMLVRNPLSRIMTIINKLSSYEKEQIVSIEEIQTIYYKIEKLLMKALFSKENMMLSKDDIYFCIAFLAEIKEAIAMNAPVVELTKALQKARKEVEEEVRQEEEEEVEELEKSNPEISEKEKINRIANLFKKWNPSLNSQTTDWKESSSEDKGFIFKHNDSLIGKVVTVTIIEGDGKQQHYNFQSDEESLRMAINHIASDINKTIPGVHLGERSSSYNSTVPIGSFYRKKSWVSKDSGIQSLTYKVSDANKINNSFKEIGTSSNYRINYILMAYFKSIKPSVLDHEDKLLLSNLISENLKNKSVIVQKQMLKTYFSLMGLSPEMASSFVDRLEEFDDIKKVDEQFFAVAYPVSDAMALYKQSLADILQKYKGHNLTPDSRVNVELWENDKVTGFKVKGYTTATLLDLALGSLYKDNWNGNIKVKGLPNEIENIFSKPWILSGNTFPITRQLEEAVRPKIAALDDESSKMFREILWRGRVARAFTFMTSQYPEFEEIVQKKVPVFTVKFNDIAVDGIIATRSRTVYTYYNLNTGQKHVLDSKGRQTIGQLLELWSFLAPNLNLSEFKKCSNIVENFKESIKILNDFEKNLNDDREIDGIRFKTIEEEKSKLYRGEATQLTRDNIHSLSERVERRKAKDNQKLSTLRQNMYSKRDKLIEILETKNYGIQQTLYVPHMPWSIPELRTDEQVSLNSIPNKFYSYEREKLTANFNFLLTTESEMTVIEAIEVAKKVVDVLQVAIMASPPGWTAAASLALSAANYGLYIARQGVEDDAERKAKLLDELSETLLLSVIGDLGDIIEIGKAVAKFADRTTKVVKSAQHIENLLGPRKGGGFQAKGNRPLNSGYQWEVNKSIKKNGEKVVDIQPIEGTNFNRMRAEGDTVPASHATLGSHGLSMSHSTVELPEDGSTWRFMAPHEHFLIDPGWDLQLSGKLTPYVDFKNGKATVNSIRNIDTKQPHGVDSPQLDVGKNYYTHGVNNKNPQPGDNRVAELLYTPFEDSAESIAKALMVEKGKPGPVKSDIYTVGQDTTLGELIKAHKDGKFVNTEGKPYETVTLSHCRNYANEKGLDGLPAKEYRYNSETDKADISEHLKKGGEVSFLYDDEFIMEGGKKVHLRMVRAFALVERSDIPNIGVYEVDPSKIRFSQSTVSYKKINGQTYDQLVESMRVNGWQKNSIIDVVLMSGGAKVSLDNTRLRAAQEVSAELVANGKQPLKVTIRLHEHHDPLPEVYLKRFNGEDYKQKHLEAMQHRINTLEKEINDLEKYRFNSLNPKIKKKSRNKETQGEIQGEEEGNQNINALKARLESLKLNKINNRPIFVKTYGEAAKMRIDSQNRAFHGPKEPARQEVSGYDNGIYYPDYGTLDPDRTQSLNPKGTKQMPKVIKKDNDGVGRGIGLSKGEGEAKNSIKTRGNVEMNEPEIVPEIIDSPLIKESHLAGDVSSATQKYHTLSVPLLVKNMKLDPNTGAFINTDGKLYIELDGKVFNVEKLQAGRQWTIINTNPIEGKTRFGPQVEFRDGNWHIMKHKGLRGGAGHSTHVQNGLDKDLYKAVMSKNVDAVMKLRDRGAKANLVDEHGNSLLDIVDGMKDISSEERSRMRFALLHSLNPSAPKDYMKPEAFHGTPWGLEILESGSLKGGITDPKGGSQSKEGQVFFSDRSRDLLGSTHTRTDLRNKPRAYSEGVGVHSANANSRAKQYRYTQVLIDSLDKNDLKMTAQNVNVEVNNLNDISTQEASEWLQNYLHESYVLKQPEISTSLETIKLEFKMPSQITLKSAGQTHVLNGPDLVDFYRKSADALKHSLESGKAPYLAMLNRGGIVPVVFGFEKIKGLQYHDISKGTKGKKVHRYAYQTEDHPLSGSSKGGALKEIELRSFEDLATLFLGMEIKGVEIPENIVFRIKGNKKNARGEKNIARYLNQSEVTKFKDEVRSEASKLADGAKLNDLKIEKLQEINYVIRSRCNGLIIRPLSQRNNEQR